MINPAAWVSLDQSDNVAASFWSYLIAALQTVESGIGASAISLLQSPQPPPIEAVLTLLAATLGGEPRARHQSVPAEWTSHSPVATAGAGALR